MKIEIDYSNDKEVFNFICICDSVVKHLEVAQNTRYNKAVSIVGEENVHKIGLYGLAIDVSESPSDLQELIEVDVNKIVQSIVTAYQLPRGVRLDLNDIEGNNK